MSSPLIDAVSSALRQGRADQAMQAARAYCESVGETREAGIEIARAAAHVYRDLIAAPVHEFADAAPAMLSAAVGELVHKALNRLIKMTTDWEGKLWAVHNERLVREMRDWTRSRHFEPAAANLARLMALVPEEQRPRRAAYIGNTLGTIVNQQNEAKKLVALIMRDHAKYQLSAEEVHQIELSRADRINKMIGVNLENIEREYGTTLSQTIVDIQETLPSKMQMGEPDENALRDVGDTFRSILRVPMWREEPDLFLDATNILADFIPREHSDTARLARIEGRAFAQLGYTAKKTVMMTFQDIGRNEFFNRIYAQWAEEYKNTDAIGNIIDVMGALRSNDFADFLKSIKGVKGVSSSVQGRVSSAMGTIGGGEATEQLIADLRSILQRRNIQSVDLRDAEKVITSLGDVVRSPRTSFEERNLVHEFLRTHVPEDLSRLAMFTALTVFTAKMAEQTGPQRQYAVRVLARSLWLSDDSTVHHKGSERQESQLGFREEIVDALEKLAPREMPTLIRAVEPLTHRYSGAYMATAELFTRLKNEETLPLLEAMLTHTLLFDEHAASSYQQEFYWDTATQSRQPITKDKILAPLVYAIGSIGGITAREILLRYKEKFTSGKVSAPSADVASFLEKFLGTEAFAKTAGNDMPYDEDLKQELSPAEINAIVKQLKAGYLFSGKMKRRQKKIEALTRLAVATPVDAMEDIFAQLADKDTMVVSAVITCLAEFAGTRKPKQIRDLTINMCLDTLEHRDPAMRQGAIKLLKEIGPARKDVKDKVIAFAKNVERRETKDALTRALKTDVGSDTLSTLASSLESGVGHEESGKGKTSDALGKLELKRQYLEARRQWIANGKIGDPPPKPPELD